MCRAFFTWNFTMSSAYLGAWLGPNHSSYFEDVIERASEASRRETRVSRMNAGRSHAIQFAEKPARGILN
jgi:hypothetical protein